MKTKEQIVEDILRDFFTSENNDPRGFPHRLWDYINEDFKRVVIEFQNFVVRRYDILRHPPEFKFLEVLPLLMDEVTAVQIALAKESNRVIKESSIEARAPEDVKH